jgi:hypothetical protein
MNVPYKTQSEIEAVVEGFESCTTSKDEFPHRSHLTVAVYYLYNSTEVDVTDRMRTGLLRFLDHHGVGRAKYHETMTVFWLKTLSEFLAQLDVKLSLLEKTNAAVETLGDSRLVYDYYSKELLASEEARKGWREPDLRAMTTRQL